MGEGMGIMFELERLALEGDELVVRGLWTGVNGMRFVRPTLHFEDRRILATLEHKPWTPSDGQTWTAAFPWTGGRAVEADRLALAVGPRLIVPLGTSAPEPAPEPAPAPIDEPAPARAAKPEAAAKPKATPAAKPRTPAVKPAPAPAAKGAPSPAAKPAPARKRASAGGPSATPPVAPVDERSDELARALAAAERERDRARAEREEILIAYTALKRQLQAEHAEADRSARGRRGEDTDTDEPIGVRTVPAMRGVMAELQYPPREPKRRLAAFDLWVVRLVGLAAAGCFLLLLVSIVRVMG